MIGFFRRIRKGLVDNNQFFKYSRYAIGEIVLVMIGILLALQVNNWNESRKANDSELQLFVKLLEDLIAEESRLDSNITIGESYVDFQLYMYNESKGRVEYDSSKYYNFLHWKHHRYNMFINEKYGESMNLITNDEIHGRLKGYINQEKITHKTVEIYETFMHKDADELLRKHGVNNTESVFNKEYNGFADRINNLEFINHSKLKKLYELEEFEQFLFTLQFHTSWMLQNFVWQKQDVRRFQLVLSNELERTKMKGSFSPILPETIGEFQLIGKSTDEIIEILIKEVENNSVYNFLEDDINDFGYTLMNEGELQKALTVFKLNILSKITRMPTQSGIESESRHSFGLYSYKHCVLTDSMHLS